MSSRKDELLAKKARLAELKRQRELRQEQYASSRQSIGEVSRPSHALVCRANPTRPLHRGKQQRNEDLRSIISFPA